MTRVARPAVGYALTLASAALFGINGTVSTLALQAGIPPTRLTALRCTGAAVCLLAVLAVVGAAAAAGHLARGALPRRLRRRGVALTQFLYYVAIGRMPVGIALVFEMTAPVFIALYVWLVRREKVRSRLWLALLLSLSGLVLVAEVWQDGGSLDPVGVGRGADRRALPGRLLPAGRARHGHPRPGGRSPAGASWRPRCSGPWRHRGGSSTRASSASGCRCRSAR